MITRFGAMEKIVLNIFYLEKLPEGLQFPWRIEIQHDTQTNSTSFNIK
jgi:hypothetical protein